MRALAREEISEDGLVAAIADAIGAPPRALLAGIGDDAAAWRPKPKHVALFTTDMLVEDVHFRLAQTSPGDLGHKALAQNLSDIAAMGGSATAAVIGFGITPAVDEAWVRAFYRGMAALASSTRCAIAGGDIVRTPVLTLGVSVVGEARRGHLRLRSGAKAGDVIAVTGPLGLAAAGLIALDSGEANGAKSCAMRAYVRPTPRMAEGRLLGSRRAVHAMMDVSDGLSTDLGRMARASAVDAVVDASQIFLHAEVIAVAQAAQRDPLTLALDGGDDYELLVAVEKRAFDFTARTFRARFGRPLSQIGTFEKGEGRVWMARGGKRELLAAGGYDHMKKQRRV